MTGKRAASMSAGIVHIILLIRFAIIFFIENSVCFAAVRMNSAYCIPNLYRCPEREYYSGLRKSSMHEMSFNKRHYGKPLGIVDVLSVASLNATIISFSDCIA